MRVSRMWGSLGWAGHSAPKSGKKSKCASVDRVYPKGDPQFYMNTTSSIPAPGSFPPASNFETCVRRRREVSRSRFPGPSAPRYDNFNPIRTGSRRIFRLSSGVGAQRQRGLTPGDAFAPLKCGHTFGCGRRSAKLAIFQ